MALQVKVVRWNHRYHIEQFGLSTLMLNKIALGIKQTWKYVQVKLSLHRLLVC